MNSFNLYNHFWINSSIAPQWSNPPRDSGAALEFTSTESGCRVPETVIPLSTQVITLGYLQRWQKMKPKVWRWRRHLGCWRSTLWFRLPTSVHSRPQQWRIHRLGPYTNVEDPAGVLGSCCQPGSALVLQVLRKRTSGWKTPLCIFLPFN